MNGAQTVAAEQQLPAPDFINGELTRLRPVLERDLPQMAALMCEAPRGFTWDNYPWSHARLKKKFEDEKFPGLWGQRERYFAISDMQDQLCGVLREEQERGGQVELDFHVVATRPDREELGRDMLAAYRDYKTNWWTINRIETALLSTQSSEREWLLGLGFDHEFTARRAWLHLGEIVDLEIYAWLPERVLANRAPDGIGA